MIADELRAKVDTARLEVEKLELEMRTLQGKLRNLDPQRKIDLEKENQELEKRRAKLQEAVERVTLAIGQPLPGFERDLEFESLRHAAVELFKKENVPQEIWKSLES